MATTRLMTAKDLERMANEDPGRYDLLDGELIRMPPPGREHSIRVVRLILRLGPVVEASGLGEVAAGAGFVVGLDLDQVVSPDVAIIRFDRIDPASRREGYYEVPPDFAIEIVSPSDYPLLVRRKVEKYQAAGVFLLWVVYPEERIVRVYRPGEGEKAFSGEDLLDASDVIPGFAMRVSEIFA
jgi:Uma2 family endonuclease